MIIVLEGVNGVGKTSAAITLADAIGATAIRPFRPHVGHHWTEPSDALGDRLRSIGVPVNTHVDDLYAGDLLAKIVDQFHKPHYMKVVLDRSMLSAMAYDNTTPSEAYRVWQEQMAVLNVETGVRLVWLHAPFEVARKRVAKSRAFFPTESDYNYLHGRFQGLFEGYEASHKIDIDTSEIPTAEVVKRILGQAD